MSVHRGIDGSDPVRWEPVARLDGTHELRRVARTRVLGAGTLACPHCDAPVALDRPLSPAEPLGRPFCGHDGALRDFLSLATPARPARVEVRVIARRR